MPTTPIISPHCKPSNAVSEVTNPFPGFYNLPPMRLETTPTVTNPFTDLFEIPSPLSKPSKTSSVVTTSFPPHSMMPSRLPLLSKCPKRSTVSSVVTNPVPKSRSRFFLLPRKIRRKIYRYVLLHDIGAWVELPLEPERHSGPTMCSEIHPNVRLWLEIPEWVDRVERPRPTPPACPIGILLTSWQTYQEVLPILYHERDFHVRLAGGTESLGILAIRSHAQLFHAMKNLNTSIIWETASSVQITMLFRIFALPVSRCNFRIRVIVLYQSTRFEVEQWFIDAIAGLKAFDNVFFGINYRLRESNYEWRHYSHLEKGVKHALGPAVQTNGGLQFRPKDYNNERMIAKMMTKKNGSNARS